MGITIGKNAHQAAQNMAQQSAKKNTQNSAGNCVAPVVKKAAQMIGAPAPVAAGAAKIAGALIDTTA